MPQLMFPNIAGATMQGFQQGQQMRANRLVGAAMQNPDDAQGYLAQAGAIDPRLALGVQGAMQQQQAQQQKAQQDQQTTTLKQIGGAARYYKAALQSGNPASVQAAKSQIAPLIMRLTGKQLPDADTPETQAALDNVIAKTAYLFPDDIKQQNPISVGPDTTLIDPRTHQVIYQGQGDAGAMVTGMTYNGMPVFRDKMGNLKDVHGNPIPQGNSSGTAVGSAASGPATGASAALPAETQAYVPKVMDALQGQPPFDQFGQPTAALLDAVQQVESGGNPNAGSPAGAQGPYQFMPATAASVGVSNPFDPQQARQGAAKYLAQLYQQFGGDANKAIAAYNAGPGRVAQAAAGAQAPAQSGLQYAPSSGGALQQKIALARKMGATDDQIRQMVLGNSTGTTSLSDDALAMGAVNYIATGKLPYFGRSDNGAREQIMNQSGDMMRAAGLNPTQLTAIQSSYKARQSALKTMQVQGITLQRNIASLDKNVQTMLQAAQAVGNTRFPSWNALQLAAKKQTGDPAVAAYAQAVMNVLDDYGKVMSMSTSSEGTTDGQLRLAQERISQSMNLQQLQAAADMIEAGGKNISDTTTDAITKLTDALQFQNLNAPVTAPGGATAPQAAPSGAPVPGTVEQGYRFKGGDPSNQANWEPVQ